MSLPTPVRTRLVNPPLRGALAQIRFDARPALAEGSAAAEIVEMLASCELSQLQQINTQTLMVAADASESPVTSVTPAGWQLMTPGGETTVSITVDQLSIETRQYTVWDEFVAVWSACLEATAAAGGPTLATRLGLRYINRFEFEPGVTPLSAVEAHGVASSFAGVVSDWPLASFVRTTEARSALAFDDGLECLLHHGWTQEAGRQVLILDIDCYDARATGFSIATALNTSAILNERSLQVLQSVVSVDRLTEGDWT